MFNENRQKLAGCKNAFYDQVRDSFGASIVADMFEPLESALDNLQQGYEQAKMEKAEISLLTAELRMIL